MTKDNIEFLKSFIKVLSSAKFDVTGTELFSIATQMQRYSKIVMELEAEMNAPKTDFTIAEIKEKKKR